MEPRAAKTHRVHSPYPRWVLTASTLPRAASWKQDVWTDDEVGNFSPLPAVTGALDVHTAGSREIKPFWEVATPYPLYTENVLLLFESTFVLPLDYKHGDCSIRRHHGA